jgi:tetratricopeptide (TPR) repeat protein
LLVVCVWFGLAGSCFAQRGESELTAPEMLAKARELLRSDQIDEAIDYMFQYLDAVEGSQLRRVLIVAQDTRYKLATLLISLERMGDAIPVLEGYVTKQPAQHIRKARRLLVACYFEESQWTNCITAVTNALHYNEHPVEYKLQRKSAMERDVDDTFGEEEEPDLPYSLEELVMLQFTKAECYYNLGADATDPDVSETNFEACLEPFTYVVDNTDNEQRKGYSLMQMINALNELNNYERLLDWVPALYKTDARYDIRVNIALLRVAASLFEAGEYDSALPLYRMILPREELIEYQEKRKRRMRVEAGLPEEFGEPLTPDEALLFGEADPARDAQMDDATAAATLSGGVTVVRDEEKEEDLEQPKEVRELMGLLETLKAMEPYENYVNFQMAQLYKAVERFWEAVEFYDLVYQTPDSKDLGERSAYEAVSVLVSKLDNLEEGERRAFEFIEKNHFGIYPRLAAYVLTSHYQRNKLWDEIKLLRPYLEKIEPSDDVMLTKYDTELYFMQGVAELMLQEYSNAVARFEFVMENYPDTAQEANSLFWCGFSFLCLDQHDNSYECFERYTRDFADLDPETSMLDEAYYQGGISLFGLDRLDEAKDRFSYVIDTFGTNSTVYPDSRNMRGDILGSLGGTNLDLAVEDYKSAFANATKASQATYATFKMCDIFKADEQFYGLDYIIEAVNLYLAEWGDAQGADIAKALFYLGRTEIQRGRYLSAAESYMQAVIDYGGDLRQDGVDMMIPELVKICTVFLDEQQRSDMINRLRIAMESTDSEVLRLRLRVALAKFDKNEVELGKQLITELDSLEHASPPVLAAICEASFALNDYSRAEEMLRIFKYKFEDSDYMRSAYKLRATGQFINNDLDGALETVIATQEEYGTDRTVSWAQLMKAQILLMQAKMFIGDELTQEQLEEASKTELQIVQAKLDAVRNQLTIAREDGDQQEESRLLKDQQKLDEKISSLRKAAQGNLGKQEIRDMLAAYKRTEAREENLNVMGVPEWRGEPFAQATFQLGEVEEAAGNLLNAHGYYQRAYFQYKGLADWCPKGYLAAADVLRQLSEDMSQDADKQAEYAEARMSTLRAMLLDKYANETPYADEAREILGPAIVEEMEAIIASGVETNIEVIVESENAESDSDEAGESA